MTIVNTYRKDQVINDLVKETSQYEIAKEYNISQPRVSQIKIENQAIIDQRKQELIGLLPDIVEISRDDIQATKDINKSLRHEINSHDEGVQKTVTNKLKFKALTQKLSQDVLKIASIYPTNALLNFNQYNQDNRQINIEPSILSLFSEGFSNNTQVIDMDEDNNNDSEANVV